MQNLPSPPLPVWSWLQTPPPPQDNLVNDKFNAGKPTQTTRTIATNLIRRDTTNSIIANQVTKISKIKM